MLCVWRHALGELEEGDPFYIDVSRATFDHDDMGSTPFAKALSSFEPEEPYGIYSFDDLTDPLQVGSIMFPSHPATL